MTLEKEAHAQWVDEWVKAVLTAENEQTPGYLLIASGEQKASYEAGMQNKKTDILLTPEQLIQRFSVTASPKAHALVGILAAAPIINFPVIRLIQKTMLPSDLSHVAEVFLSGIIKQISTDSTKLDAISYDFVEGVRDLILDSQPQSKSANVLRIAIAHFVGQQIGQWIFFSLVRLTERGQIDSTKRGWLVKMFSDIRLARPALVKEVNATESRIQSILKGVDQAHDREGA